MDNAHEHALGVILDEARQNVDSQSGQLDELRNRAGTMLGVAALTLSVLAAVDADGELSAAGIGGAGFLVAAAAVLVYVLWPHRGWRFSVNTRAMLETLSDDGPDQFTEMLVRQKRNDLVANGDRLGWLYDCFRAAIVFAGAAVVLFILEVLEGR